MWNYLAKLKQAIADGHGEDVMYSDQMADLLDLLDSLFGTHGILGIFDSDRRRERDIATTWIIYTSVEEKRAFASNSRLAFEKRASA